jgi:integrase
MSDEASRTKRPKRNENNGIRKLCSCARRAWPKCAHPWHFNFKLPNGDHFRFSLEKRIGRIIRVEKLRKTCGCSGSASATCDHPPTKRLEWARDRSSLGPAIVGKTEAQQEAERLRLGIRNGSLLENGSDRPQSETLTVAQLMDAHRKHASVVRACSVPSGDARQPRKTNVEYQIGKMFRTVLERPDGTSRAFGEWLVADVTTDTIEQYRRVRISTPIGTNRDLSLLRAMFNWATSKRRNLAADNPFLDGSKPAVKFGRESRRTRRLRPGEAPALLAVCNPHLRALVEAALETGCRRGELLSMQWWQVRFTPKAEIILPGQKTKTKQERRVPMSARLQGILSMRRLAPDGTELAADHYVFGTQLGEPVKNFKRAWQRAVLRAHGHKPQYVVRIVREKGGERRVPTALLTPESQATLRSIDLHFHDLRREAGSRWLDHGVPLHRIQQWLGHANISQTSTYLMAETADDGEAMRRFEARLAAASASNSLARDGSGPQSPAEAVTTGLVQ